MSPDSRQRRKHTARSRFTEPDFIFSFSLLHFVFLALRSGSNMEMKKRVGLELKNRNPAEVCNINYNRADFNLFSEDVGEGCRLERHDDAENIQRGQTSRFLC